MDTQKYFSSNEIAKRRNILALKTDFITKRRFNSPRPEKVNQGNLYQQKNSSTIKIKQGRIGHLQLMQERSHEKYKDLKERMAQDPQLLDDYKKQIHQTENEKVANAFSIKAGSTRISLASQSKREETANKDVDLIYTSNDMRKITEPAIRSSNIDAIKYSSSPLLMAQQNDSKFSKIVSEDKQFKSQPKLDSIKMIKQNENQFFSKSSIVLQQKDLLQSIVIPQVTKSKLKRCLSLQFKKNEEKKMKLKDYMYMNSMSGIRKKVSVEKLLSDKTSSPRSYIRVRQFSSDQMIECKIKSQIQNNVKELRKKLKVFQDMKDYHADKLMLYNFNRILQQKIAKAWSEIENLISRYEKGLQ